MSESHPRKSISNLIQTAVDMAASLVLVVCVFQMMAFIMGSISQSRQYGANEKGFEHVDFINTYMAGKIAESDDRQRLYDANVQQNFYNQIIAPAKTFEHCFYQYPPYVFLMATPLTLLSLNDAFKAFDLCTAAFGLACLYLLMRTNPNLPQWERLLVLVAALGSFPSLDNLRDGQFAWAFVALFSLYFWAFLRNKPILAGIALGLIAIKPHYFLFLFIGALICRRYKLLVIAVSVLLLLLVASGLALGWDSVLSYPSLLRQIESSTSTALLVPERMICLRGPVSMFLPREAGLIIGAVCFLSGLLLTAFYWYLAQVRKLFSISWAMALSIILLLIASPHTLVYDATIVAVAASLTLRSARVTRMLAASPLSLKIWNCFLVIYPLLSWLIMIYAPKLAEFFFHDSFKSIFSVNGSSFGLASFPCFLLLNAVLLVSGSVYVLSGAAKHELQTPALSDSEFA